MNRVAIPVSAELLLSDPGTREYVKSRASILAGQPVKALFCLQCPSCDESFILVDTEVEWGPEADRDEAGA